MENKIQELTDKIYKEGVEQGNAEAQRLIVEANEQARKIIADAKKEADAIVTASQKTAIELAENTKSELQLFARQSVNALKSEVTSLLTDRVIKESVQNFVTDKEYFQKFMLEIATKWSANEPIVISTANADSLKKYFATYAKALLDKGITINEVNGIQTLFTISPANGAYKVNFGEEEFENYFKEFLRPQLVEMLF